MAVVQVARVKADLYVAPSSSSTIQVAALSAISATPTSSLVQVARVSATSLSGASPTIQVARLRASTPVTITGPDNVSITSGQTVTLTATAPTATAWEWSQVSGPTIIPSISGGKATVTGPALETEQDIVLQVRATISGAQSAWSPVTISVERHHAWLCMADGSIKPLYDGTTSVPVDPDPPGSPGADPAPIACWGDSMTAGFGIGLANSWPTKLAGMLTAPATTWNGGVSGQTAQEIAIRQGGQTLTLTASGGTIPASGSVALTFPEAITWSTLQGFTSTGTLAGVPGTISKGSGSAGLSFTRTTAGTATACTALPWVPDGDQYRGKVAIIDAGRNDYGIGGVDATIRSRVIGANTNMVNHLTTSNFLVLGNMTVRSETTGTRGYNNVVAVNNGLAQLYGTKFFDVRRWLIDNGLTALGIAPTADDTAAIAGDTLPPSLMYDTIHWNAATANLVAQQVFARIGALGYLSLVDQPTANLFFKMPNMASSTKKVFAHYFGPYPRSINNSATLAGDSYTTVFNNPSYATYAARGGMFRDRPIFRPQLSGDFKYQDCVFDIQQAKAAGIDGFFCDLLGLSGSNYDNYETLKRAADDLNNGFKIIPMIDANGATGAATPQQAAAYVKTFANRNSAFYLPDGRFLVSAFKTEGKPLQWWSDMLTSLSNDWGINAAYMGVFVNINQAPNYATVQYGSSAWGYGADPSVINAAGNYATAAHARGEVWMAPIVGQDIRPGTAALYDECVGFQALQATCMKAINQGADYWQLVTWSDFSETAMTPSAANGWTHLDLISYYLTRWKTGSFPAILRDAVYVAHRSHTTNATITGGETQFTTHWARGNMSPASNDVHVLTFLVAPATVTVRVGASTYTYDAAAGMFAKNYPVEAGSVSVSVARSGSVVASLSSPVTVRTSIPADDFQYFRFSSLRGTTGQFDPLTQY